MYHSHLCLRRPAAKSQFARHVKKPEIILRFSFFCNICLSQCTGELFPAHPVRITPLRHAVIHLTAECIIPFFKSVVTVFEGRFFCVRFYDAQMRFNHTEVFMESFATLFIPVILVFLLLRVIILPIRWCWKLCVNSACGFLCLWLLNSVTAFTGISFPVNWITVMVAGFLGLPGIGALALVQLFL